MNATRKSAATARGFFGISFCVLLGMLLLLTLGSSAAHSAVQDVATDANVPSTDYRLPDDPYELIRLDNEMKAFFATRIHRGAPIETTLDEISDAILGESGLNFRYESCGVYDVREAFRRRRGNCLTYSMLVVAIAREFGIHAQFNEVTIYPRWNRTGGIILVSGHINVRVETASDSYEVDLKLNDDLRVSRSSARVVNDARAFAGVYNNVGVYRLAAGDRANALRLMETATAIDPTSTSAWTNLGTALILVGQTDRARKCYERALAAQPDMSTALSGLATLNRRSGRIAEAEKLERQVAHYRERNPYYLFSIARGELSSGDFKSARRHLRRAINIKDDESEFYELMAEVARGQGLDGEAKRWMAKSKKDAS
jgi:tetratricopeptide (TPR) repeat protein